VEQPPLGIARGFRQFALDQLPGDREVPLPQRLAGAGRWILRRISLRGVKNREPPVETQAERKRNA